MATTQKPTPRDPRNQPDGSNDRDKHGRKQHSGSSQDTAREPGSKPDRGSDDMRDEASKLRAVR